MTLSEKLQTLRKEAGLTQEQLAERIQVSRQAVSKWESGQARPGIDKLRQLSDVFHISVDELLSESPLAEIMIAEDVCSLIEPEIIRPSEKRKSKGLRVILGCLSLMSSLILLSGIPALGFIMEKKQLSYTWPSLPIIAQMLAVCLGGSGGVLLTRKVKTRRAWLTAAGAVLAMLALGIVKVNSETRTIVSFSDNHKIMMILKQDPDTGKTTLYRSVFTLFCREKEDFPYAVRGKLKIQWLTTDIAAVTYRTLDNTVHQYAATYGDRGSGISYNDPRSAINGHWTAADLNNADVKLTADREGIHIETGSERQTYAYSDAVPFGTTAIVLCENGLPQWTIAFGEGSGISDQGLLEHGELILCPVSMAKTMPVTLICTDASSTGAKPLPTPDPAEAEAALIAQMRQKLADDPQLSDLSTLPEGTLALDTTSEDPVSLALAALRRRDEDYRVNGVDVRVQLTEGQVIAGGGQDVLVRLTTREAYVSPGNQGASPSGESNEWHYNVRLMQSDSATLAAVFFNNDNGISGLTFNLQPPVQTDADLAWHYFLPGITDTTYMYINRLSPAEAASKLIKERWPEAEAIGETDYCVDRDKNLILMYDGIDEDLACYRFWLVHNPQLKDALFSDQTVTEGLIRMRIQDGTVQE